MNHDENERQYHVIDQSLTAHSKLRDVYARRAMFLGNGLLASSAILCTFVFPSDEVFLKIGLDPSLATLGLGFFSVLVFVLSLIETRVNWKGISSRHAEAAELLSRLKLKFRKSFADTKGEDATKNASLGREFVKVQSALPRIPEKWFIPLKAEHSFKKLLSQRISAHPKAPVWFLRLQLRFGGLRAAWKDRRPSYDSNGQKGLDAPDDPGELLPPNEGGGD